MLRWMFFLRYPDGIAKEDGEAWYLGTHTQEAKALKGLRRYRTWSTRLAVTAPNWTTVERLNRWDRVTELAFDDWDVWHRAAVLNPPAYTPAPYGPRGFHAETIFIADPPSETFLEPRTEAPADLVRWLFLLRYPETIAESAGEAWYLGTHTREAREMRQLWSYSSWKQLPGGPPPPSARPHWARLTELAFPSFDAWEDGAVRNMPAWTPPAYEGPGFFSETAFIGSEPDYDLLTETPRIPTASARSENGPAGSR